MTSLDESIKHYEEIAEEKEKFCKVNDDFNFSQPEWRKCAEEHRQLAEWLKELRFYRTMIPSASEYFRTGKVDAE